MRNLVLFLGLLHPALVTDICKHISLGPGQAELAKFKNGEILVTVKDSVRNQDVYVVQSLNGHINDMFMELLIMILACKLALAKKVTAVLPLFPYLRQPDLQYHKRAHQPSELGLEYAPNTTDYKEWVAQTGTLIADLLTTAGADRIITMDLHDPQFQGYFDIPVDNLYSQPLLTRYITLEVENYRDCVIVLPDAGGAKRATAIADSLGLSFALIHKESRTLRYKTHQSEPSNTGLSTTLLVGDVKDKKCIIIDDLLDTSSTVIRAARILKDQGAVSVIAIITHGVFSGDAIERIKRSEIDKVVVSDSLPQDSNKAQFSEGEFEVLSVSRIFAEAIRRIHNGESVSMLFDNM